ncbi:cobalt transport protein [Fannyhessea vaginae PB189-T1-4]|uniref:Cobalt transport protein n=1 Tax=Fannyhessea vaginae PB189-T1-4 TaxID=866774 RepID=A0ABP2J1C5_9ACTN|nr:cobalt transport protein [Fannyhessea vaginae PB189-T1-4]
MTIGRMQKRMDVLELHNVGFRYANGAFALQNVSFSLAAGRRVCLVGANGSGKSTIVRILSGALVPQTGWVRFVDAEHQEACTGEHASGSVNTKEHASNVEPASQAVVPALSRPYHERIAFVHQDAHLHFTSPSLRESMTFALGNFGWSEDRMQAAIAHIRTLCKLTHQSDRIYTLSGGQQQRAAIAQALVQAPDILVLDEAFSHLDATAHAELKALVHDFTTRGAIGVLEITHDLQDVQGADEVIVLKDGHMFAHCTSAEFLANPQLVEAAGMVEFSAPVELCSNTFIDEKNPGNHSYQHGAPQFVASAITWQVPLAGVRALLHPVHKRSLVHVGTCASSNVASAVAAPHAAAQDALTLALRSGDLCIIAGKSGSGKTSCALSLAGITPLLDGALTLNGAPVQPGDVGFVFQQSEDMLFCATVLDEVMFGALQEGSTIQDARARAEDALHTVGIGANLYASNPLELSGGLRRRVGIAATIVLHRRVYIFDEPTCALDGNGRHDFFHMVARLRAQGACVLIVSHDPLAFAQVATQFVIISHMQSRGVFTDVAEFTAAAEQLGIVPATSITPAASVTPATSITPATTHESTPISSACLLISLIAYVITTALVHNGYVLLALMVTALVCARVCAVSLRVIKLISVPLIWLFVVTFACNALVYLPQGASTAASTAAFTIPFTIPFAIRPDAALRSVFLAIKLLSASVATASAAVRLSAIDIGTTVSRVTWPLSRFGIKTQHIGLITTLVLSAIPSIYQTAQRIICAQRLRGVDFARGTLFARVSRWLYVCAPLIMSVFYQVDIRATTMTERGYTGVVRHVPLTARQRLRLAIWTIFCCISSALLLLLDHALL